MTGGATLIIAIRGGNIISSALALSRSRPMEVVEAAEVVSN